MNYPLLGDVVQLRSGGPRMTIIDENGDIREAGWFSYGVFARMQANAAAFMPAGVSDEEVDTLVTDAIPNYVAATFNGQTEEFRTSLYSLGVSPGGERIITVDVPVPTNSLIDFSAAEITVGCNFISRPDGAGAQVVGSYLETGPIVYQQGTLVRIVRIAIAEPATP